jgi:hypothetical protein
MKGQAADFVSTNLKTIPNSYLFYLIVKHLPYDQVIWEFGNNNEPDWIHVSYTIGRRRKSILKASKNSNNGTEYAKITNNHPIWIDLVTRYEKTN